MLQPQAVYAGDTPLACTLTVEQTGPLQLTVRAGSFTTTGEAHIVDAGSVADPAALVAAGQAEWLPDGTRLRVWQPRPGGTVPEPSATHVLATDQTFALTADATDPKAYQLELGLTAAGVVDVLCRSQLQGEALPAAPAGWEPIHWLAGPFVLPPSAVDLGAIAIPVFAVLPGFPAGTTAADWAMQRGGG